MGKRRRKDKGSGLHFSLSVNNEDLTLNFTEKWYQERWCRERGGQVEVVLPDNTRCDCVTDTHVIEFDFGQYPAKAVYRKLFYDLTI